MAFSSKKRGRSPVSEVDLELKIDSKWSILGCDERERERENGRYKKRDEEDKS